MKTYIFFLPALCLHSILLAPAKRTSTEEQKLTQAQVTAPKKADEVLHSPRHTQSQNASTPSALALALSAKELKEIQEIEATAEKIKQQQTIDEKIKALEDLRITGWDTADLDEKVDPCTTKPKPTLLQQVLSIPTRLWTEHVTNRNRIEHIIKFSGTPVYIILLWKLKSHQFKEFIQDLNEENPREGYRWIDEGISRIIQDNNEVLAMKLIDAAKPYKRELIESTKKEIIAYLNHYADKNRKALLMEIEEYEKQAAEVATLMKIIEDPTNTKHESIPVERIEQYALEHALQITQQATESYLPKTLTFK
jgi:hypothetical protein